jgi:acetyltransferase-like isoleucine patch superfamily enzyme
MGAGVFHHPIVRWLAKKSSTVRLPGNPIHRALAWEYWLRRMAVSEASRILYYQPMFETLCQSVGAGFRLQTCPESKVPIVGNVDIDIGRNTQVSARLTLSGAPSAPERARIRIGNHCYLGDRCVLRSGLEIVIGDYVLIGTNALISCDPGHPMDAHARRTRPAPAERLGRITIENDVWISYNVSILGNVTLGEGSVIGANSVVVSDIPAFSLVAGNPARVIRSLKEPREAGNVVLAERLPGLFVEKPLRGTHPSQNASGYWANETSC